LKPERWGSLLVQEKYREEMSVTETSISYNNNNNNNNNKLYKTLYRKKHRGEGEVEEEDVSSYWIGFWKRNYSGH